jgi:beta-galactosidase
MELQPGQVNWGRFNSQTMPGTVRMWIWHAFAGGNKFVCNYRFKQPLTGGEQYHYGVIGPDGLTPSTGGQEYMKVNEEMKFLRRNFDPNAQVPAEYKARQAAVLYSQDNRWEQDNQPQTFQWDYMNHLKHYYGALKQLGAPVDVITEDKDFKKYPVLIAPAYQLLDAKLVERWRQYVDQGGHLVLTTRTGQKDRNGKIFESTWTSSIQTLMSGIVSFYDHLPDNRTGTVKAGAETYNWNNWADIIEPYPNIEIWATYTNQYYAGRPAVIHKVVGKGSVTYVGPDTDDGALEKAILKRVYADAGISVRDLPEGVIIEWRDGFWVGVNYGENAYEVPVPDRATILIGTKTLKPADVIVWKE